MAATLLQPGAPPSITTAATYGYDSVFQWLLFNKGKDGKISPSEFLAAVAASYSAISKHHDSTDHFLTAEEAGEMVVSADSDGDGHLGTEEFTAMLALEGDQMALARELEEAFSVFRDTDGSGRITPASLQKALGMLGNERSIDKCAEMIHKFDVDGDGGVCFEEFRLMMAS